MKVLLLNTKDASGGSARATSRLHRGLRSLGIDSTLFVQSKTGGDYTVIASAQTDLDYIWSRLRPRLDKLPTRLYPSLGKAAFSPAGIGDRLSTKIPAYSPDIIHLNWINDGFLKIETLKKFQQPLVWTLHDSWAFTGGCHVPQDCKRYRQDCGACPVLGSNRDYDLSRWVLHRKRKAWKSLPLTVVTPSRWLADCARSSTLFRDMDIKVIPNGIDLERFKPVDRTLARQLLSLPPDRKFILFGAMNVTSDRNKGFHLLLPALQQLATQGWADNTELIIFGAGEPRNPPDFGLPSSYLGEMHDDISLRLLYSAADVFVAPSMQENLPCTVMEALACGIPCVAFNIGGMPDMLTHQRNGYLAQPYEMDDLAQGIAWVLKDRDRYQHLSEAARYKIETEFSQELYAQRYATLYEELLKI